jgi:aldehyde dehydrogenase (NAD(P)+)
VQDTIYEDFLARFTQKTKDNAAKIGDPFHEDTYQGPQVSKEQFDKVLGYIDEGKKAGARVLHGGAKHGDKGFFVQPTVFADVRHSHLSPSQPLF